MEDLCSEKRPSCGSVCVLSLYRAMQNVVLLLVISMAVVGCGQNIQDLQQYVEEVKARKSSKVEPLPEIKPYQKFEYQAQSLRDPFDSSELNVKVRKPVVPKSSQLVPKEGPPEYLESFPLDTLRMVGTLSQGEQLWALIKAPDSTIQRVKRGDYMGQNYGQVVGINEDKIRLTELVRDEFGWRKRDALLALME